MPDGCDGRSHGDDDWITWREFNREMLHRDRILEVREETLSKESQRESSATLAIAEHRAASNRILVAVIGLVSVFISIVMGAVTVFTLLRAP